MSPSSMNIINATHTRVYNCPETYDCICGTSDCVGNGATFCCPSKGRNGCDGERKPTRGVPFAAYACTLGSDAGQTPASGGGTYTRYYHDPISDECKAFMYRGSGGNANNFETKEHCESYCLTGSCEAYLNRSQFDIQHAHADGHSIRLQRIPVK
jgi:hypothetical protein